MEPHGTTPYLDAPASADDANPYRPGRGTLSPMQNVVHEITVWLMVQLPVHRTLYTPHWRHCGSSQHPTCFVRVSWRQAKTPASPKAPAVAAAINTLCSSSFMSAVNDLIAARCCHVRRMEVWQTARQPLNYCKTAHSTIDMQQ
jgi:hypothetical protein